MCVMKETLSVGLVITSGYREGKKERRAEKYERERNRGTVNGGK